MAANAQSLYEHALTAYGRDNSRGAERLAAEALARRPSGDLLAAIQHLCARIVVSNGEPLRAYELLLTEAAAVESSHPRHAAKMLGEAAMCALSGGEVEAAIRTAARGRDLAHRRARDVEPELALTYEIAGTFTDDAKTAASAILAVLGRGRREDLIAGWEPFMRSASVLYWIEEYDRARIVLEQLLETARTFGLRALLAVALDTLAAVDFRTGRWALADARSAEALRLARELGQTGQTASCLTTLAGIAAARGDGEACRRYAEGALALRNSNTLVEPWARTALASFALSRGDAGAAIGELEGMLDSTPVLDSSMVPWPRELVEAYVRVGRDDDARRIAELVAMQTHSAKRPGIRAAVAHCLGLTADWASFSDRFEEALDWFVRTDTPFYRARTNLVYGIRLRRARRAGEAKVHLELALATFERLGARLWSERARAELSSGRRAARGPAALRDILTPHELEVALLVGGGATNKEAAAALFVSPKTIDYHLASVYRKLELRSRTELAAMIARQER